MFSLGLDNLQIRVPKILLQHAFERLDTDKDGKLSFEEFTKIYGRSLFYKMQEENDPHAHLRKTPKEKIEELLTKKYRPGEYVGVKSSDSVVGYLIGMENSYNNQPYLGTNNYNGIKYFVEQFNPEYKRSRSTYKTSTESNKSVIYKNATRSDLNNFYEHKRNPTQINRSYQLL